MDMTIENLPSVAATLASRWVPGIPLCLYGPLGVGKTTLSRALIQYTLPQEEFIASPSFPLMIPYEEDIWHVDLYRINDEKDILQLGLLEIMAMNRCIIEWPERLGSLMPAHRIDVMLSFTDKEEVRRVYTATY